MTQLLPRRSTSASLGKALMGRGRPAEHWAHSEYAWLVFEDGDLSVCLDQCSHCKGNLLYGQLASTLLEKKQLMPPPGVVTASEHFLGT